MDERDWLAQQFETQRPHLERVAYRMLGSPEEADDAVQEAWLRFSRADTRGVENLRGWLTTVVGRVCLDMLRSRKTRREESLDAYLPELAVSRGEGAAPENEAALADSVGLALQMVLETLAPAERIAFVLHDMFAIPFDEIASIVGRSPTAARQLASRARRRVQGAGAEPGENIARQRKLIEAFRDASRRGDFAALLEVLDPEIVVHADAAAAPDGLAREVHGAQAAAEQALSFAKRARFAQPALVNGTAGFMLAPRGRLKMVLAFKFKGEKIAEIDVIAEPERLQILDLEVI